MTNLIVLKYALFTVHRSTILSFFVAYTVYTIGYISMIFSRIF
jgi:hypothetical protein